MDDEVIGKQGKNVYSQRSGLREKDSISRDVRHDLYHTFETLTRLYMYVFFPICFLLDARGGALTLSWLDAKRVAKTQTSLDSLIECGVCSMDATTREDFPIHGIEIPHFANTRISCRVCDVTHDLT